MKGQWGEKLSGKILKYNLKRIGVLEIAKLLISEQKMYPEFKPTKKIPH